MKKSRPDAIDRAAEAHGYRRDIIAGTYYLLRTSLRETTVEERHEKAGQTNE